METYINQLIFGVGPYLAGTIFPAGQLPALRARPVHLAGHVQPDAEQSPAFRWASIAFHVGILLLFFGHLFGLLTPSWLYHAFGLSSGAKQLIAIIAGGIFGVLCFAGLSYLVYRRLFNARVRANSSTMDTFIICLIYLQLLTGLLSLLVSKNHLDGAVMVQLGHWAQSIVTFQGGAWQYIVDVHWIYKLHIFLGLIMFTAFPFSRLVHIWSWPIGYISRRRYQVVRPQ